MSKFKARIGASKEGSIGTKYCEKRTYIFEARDACAARQEAIRLPYLEGLEHVRVEQLEELK